MLFNSRIYPQEIIREVEEELITVLFVIVKHQEQLTCPQIRGR